MCSDAELPQLQRLRAAAARAITVRFNRPGQKKFSMAVAVDPVAATLAELRAAVAAELGVASVVLTRENAGEDKRGRWSHYASAPFSAVWSTNAGTGNIRAE